MIQFIKGLLINSCGKGLYKAAPYKCNYICQHTLCHCYNHALTVLDRSVMLEGSLSILVPIFEVGSLTHSLGEGSCGDTFKLLPQQCPGRDAALLAC